MRDIAPADVGSGSWLCENSSARRARRNISKKLRTVESNRAARTMFDTLLENCIFYISQLYEFSHRLGHSRRIDTFATRAACPLSLRKRPSPIKMRSVASCQKATFALQQISLFDHLVGER